MARFVVVLCLLLGCTGVAGLTATTDARSTQIESVADVRDPSDRGSEVDPGARDGGIVDSQSFVDVASIRTTLRVHYPVGMRMVSLRGDLAGLSWERGVSISRVTDDLWEWSSDGVARPFEWKPLLDDREWSIGSNYRATPGATMDIYPRFVTRSGRWSRAIATFHSTILKNDRGIWLYLPPAYDENPLARFPVVYMHDGQNLFNPATAFGAQPWYAQNALNDGADSGAIREAIIVGIENSADRINEYTPTRDATRMAGGQGDPYLRLLIEELKPLVDRTYRTLPGPADTVLLGSSLGGLISAYAGVHHAEVFGQVGAMSPSTWWDDRMLLREAALLRSAATRPIRIYVDSGDSGDSSDDVANTAALADVIRGAGYRDGIDFRYLVQPGAIHNELYWAQRLPGALAFLLGRRDP